ncbi:aminodeoxychorismate lyase [Microbacterium halophytorum]|uniref:aminodeoxychorismate lyase n=1 Tax=Microbacterium halophytorum TaxID=2067568 RepID=UPI000CFAE9BB|nr:aminodeoxychorismate lyase [Microbacterium halophytorum]
MTRFAFLIDPAPADAGAVDLDATIARIDPDQPALSVGDMSANRGDGVFESIGVFDGRAKQVGPHLDRLANSARLLDMPEPNRAQWRRAVETAVAAVPDEGEWTIKLLISRGVQIGAVGAPSSGPTAWVTASRSADYTAQRTDGIRVVSLDRGYDSNAAQRSPWLLLGAKTLSYAVNMAAAREARRRGADEAVFTTTDGYLLEAPTANLILRRGDQFVTPEPTAGLLHGTTQLEAFDWLEDSGYPTGYEHLPAAALADADAAWFVSSIRLAAPISSIDGRALPVDHALTAALNDYLRS